jgi:hypothetical protein
MYTLHCHTLHFYQQTVGLYEGEGLYTHGVAEGFATMNAQLHPWSFPHSMFSFHMQLAVFFGTEVCVPI